MRTNGKSANSHVTMDVNMSQNHKTLNIKYVKQQACKKDG